nr:MAG TPA: hypothetical protein [Caudoviricetes sp.]
MFVSQNGLDSRLSIHISLINLLEGRQKRLDLA